MHTGLKHPCNDCPFRRNAIPGWLGNSGPEWFVDSALSDFATYQSGAPMAPCHLTVDYEDPNWEDTLEESHACVGALQFCANNYKMPRDPVRAAAVREAGMNENVFSTRDEFIEYHTRKGQKHADHQAADKGELEVSFDAKHSKEIIDALEDGGFEVPEEIYRAVNPPVERQPKPSRN